VESELRLGQLGPQRKKLVALHWGGEESRAHITPAHKNMPEGTREGGGGLTHGKKKKFELPIVSGFWGWKFLTPKGQGTECTPIMSHLAS